MDTRLLSKPVLAIGLDAFDISELQRRLAEGALPNIASLADAYSVRTLAPDTAGFGAMAWVSFVNAMHTAEHGWYFRKVWDPETGQFKQASDDFLHDKAFWQPLQRAGMRLALIDVPRAPDPGEGFNGVYLNGWQTHDEASLRSNPEQLLGDLYTRFGAPKLLKENYGPQRAFDLLAIRQQTLDSIRQITEITEWLLRNDRFDLGIVVIGGAHRAGHYLWNLSQIDRDGLEPAEVRALEAAMDDIYLACDEAVGRIASAAPDYSVMAFAAHGMRANPGWNDAFPDILRAMIVPQASQQPSFSVRDGLHRFRRSPLALRLSRKLPGRINGMVSRAWASNMHNWSKTRYFSLPGEVVGIVRLNIAGREPQGIVPMDQALELAEELAADLRELRDLETDELLVSDIHITDHLIPASMPFRLNLPDVMVEWRDRPMIDSIGVKLANGRELRWPRGRRVTSGRSGDHRQYGWIIGDFAIEAAGNQRPTTVDLSRTLVGRMAQQRVFA